MDNEDKLRYSHDTWNHMNWHLFEHPKDKIILTNVNGYINWQIITEKATYDKELIDLVIKEGQNND